MIVAKLELHSAITGKVTEIGRMIIANDGSGTPTRGDYDVFLGRKGHDLNAAVVRNPQRKGKVLGHARQAYSVWRLVARALESVGFKP